MHDRGTSAFSALVGVGIALTAAAALIVTWLPPSGTPPPRPPSPPRPPPRSVPQHPVRPGGRVADARPGRARLPDRRHHRRRRLRRRRRARWPAQAWLTSAGVPSAAAAGAAAALTHPFVVWTGPVAGTDTARLQQFAQGGGVLVIDGDSAAAESLAGVSQPAAATRDRLATLAGGGVPAETLGFPAGRTSAGIATPARSRGSPTAPPRSPCAASAPASWCCSARRWRSSWRRPPPAPPRPPTCRRATCTCATRWRSWRARCTR